MITNNTSTNLITDSARYLLVRRTLDDSSPDTGPDQRQAHFYLSPPIGNRGPLNLSTPEDDLDPSPLTPGELALLCHKPLGLWLALSFDHPDPNAGESPVKQTVRAAKRLRKSGERGPTTEEPGVLTRSRTRAGVAAARGQGARSGRGGAGTGAGVGGQAAREGGRRRGRGLGGGERVENHLNLKHSYHSDKVRSSLSCSWQRLTFSIQSIANAISDLKSSSSELLVSPVPIMLPQKVRSCPPLLPPLPHPLSPSPSSPPPSEP